MSKRKTALIGFGKIAQGYARDQVMASVMQYTSHAQVLTAHPAFDFCAVVDNQETALAQVADTYPDIQVAKSCASLPGKDDIEVLILATPPDHRLTDIKAFSNLKAVMVEKPLGVDLTASKEFLQYCQQKQIKVQVNLLRRADELTNSLASGGLSQQIGALQTGWGLYGNGVKNNGVHMVDLVRLLLGPVVRVCALPGLSYSEGPITGDTNLPFVLTLVSGASVFFSPVKFSAYRENALQLIGEAGKLDYMHGGLTVTRTPVGPSRMVTGECELVYDKPQILTSTLGNAFYRMYDNLAKSLDHDVALYSPAESALASTAIVDAVLRSAANGFQPQTIEP